MFLIKSLMIGQCILITKQLTIQTCERQYLPSGTCARWRQQMHGKCPLNGKINICKIDL